MDAVPLRTGDEAIVHQMKEFTSPRVIIGRGFAASERLVKVKNGYSLTGNARCEVL